MFSASRKAKARRTSQAHDGSIMSNHFAANVAEHCKQGIMHANNAMANIGQEITCQLTGITLGDPSVIFNPNNHKLAALPRPALFASVSSTQPSNSEPMASFPSKFRARLPGKLAGNDSSSDQTNASSATDSPSSDHKANNNDKKKGEEEEERILISEVDVSGADGELRDAVLKALTTRPNFAYTVREVQEDVQRVFDTGYFSSCRPRAEDTRDGVRLTVEVTPNPELRGVVSTGAARLPQAIIQDAFHGMRGRTLNYNALTRAVAKLNSWYEEHGVLGQVIDVELGQGDVAQVKVAEATVNRIALRYVDPKTGEAREEGKTRPDIVLRHLTTQPGQVYNLKQAKNDIEAVYSMGLFEDVSIRPQPAEGSTVEAPRVDLTLEVKERKKTGGLAAGGGISAAGAASEGSLPGFVGTLSYSQRNLFGLGQRLVASAEVGQMDSTFRVAHTDPWVRGDAYRTSRTISAQNTKVSAAPVHGLAADEAFDASVGGGGTGGIVAGGVGAGGTTGATAAETTITGPSVYVTRIVSGIEYGRPLGMGWQGSLGVNWQQAKCVDDHNKPLTHDMYGGPLMINRGNKGRDTMALGTIRVAYSAPSGDTELVASMEQAVPLQRDWLNFNRFTLRADKGIPLGPLRLWVSGKGGAIVGDLPPYEAFPIGGTNSVRGYNEGGVGSGRNYLSGIAEIHFPLIQSLQGSLFCDYGSDLGSGHTVPGDPAGSRQKPGAGFGAGAGVRFDTPIGPLRLEYAMNDAKKRRFHLGIGSHG
jgi:outer membrane protein insertion porin family